MSTKKGMTIKGVAKLLWSNDGIELWKITIANKPVFEIFLGHECILSTSDGGEAIRTIRTMRAEQKR